MTLTDFVDKAIPWVIPLVLFASYVANYPDSLPKRKGAGGKRSDATDTNGTANGKADVEQEMKSS